MSARQDLSQLLDKWRELTRAEGGAIESAAWPAMRAIQSDKARLQKSLDAARQQWARENPAVDVPFQAEVARLVSLEARNAELLAAQIKRAEAERATLDQAYRNLVKIRRSYVRKQPPAEWQCYS